jgi:hypothetical protein
MRKTLATLIALFGFATTANAVEFHFDGYVDFRAVIPGDQESWMQGGLGKLRYGTGDGNFQFAELVGQGVVQITPALMLLGVARIEPNQRTFLDVLETYVRYRPVSTSAFRWSIKAGAFFPPISLENTEVGWTSPWTLTQSAINTWVGEELRTIGLEGTVEWRSDARTISAYASIYGWNDPAGALVDARGWALHDRPTGLIDQPVLPYAFTYPDEARQRTWEFLEIDYRPGWYAGAAWDETGLGRIDVLYYNNEADPTAIRKDVVAWRTDFWNIGFKTNIGQVTLLAQGLRGETYIKPSPYYWSDTYYESAYLLAGYNITEDWRIAGRGEVFSVNDTNMYESGEMSEHGHALTFAVNYLPYDWLRVSGEVIRVESTRNQRTIEGDPAHVVETQFQLSVRFYLP